MTVRGCGSFGIAPSFEGWIMSRIIRLSASALAVAIFVTHRLPAQDFLVSRPAPETKPAEPVAVGATLTTNPGEVRRQRLDNGAIVLLNQRSKARYAEKGRFIVDSGEVVVDAPRAAGLTVTAGNSTVVLDDAKIAVRVAEKPSVAVLRGAVKGEEKSTTFVLRTGEFRSDGRNQQATATSQSLDWAAPLMDEALLVPASQYSGGTLLAKTNDGQDAKISLRKFHIDVHIEDGFARTTIDQTYFNHENTPLEGTFYFPLPADASLSRLAMYVDGNLREGAMVERNRGRDIYESIRYANRDPALLEWVDGTTFKMRVFPLEPRTERRIILSYSQRLPVAFGETHYRFPAGHSLQTVDDWSFAARIVGGADLNWKSPSHNLKRVAAFAPSPPGNPGREGRGEGGQLPSQNQNPNAKSPSEKTPSPPAPGPRSTGGEGSGNGDLLLHASAKKTRTDRDLVLTLTDPAEPPQLRVSTAELDGSKYMMIRYRPTIVSQPAPAKKHWAFLFESSGDRDPLLARAQIEIIRQMLTQLNPDDTFQVIAAGTRAKVHADPQPATPDAIASAIGFLEKSHLIGALDLSKAFDALSPSPPGNPGGAGGGGGGVGPTQKLDGAPKSPSEKTPSPLTPLPRSTGGEGNRNGDMVIVHVGSGFAALGERRAEELIKKLPRGQYVGVGVGRRWDRAFMKRAAAETGGHFTHMNPDEPLAWRAFELMTALRAPRLLDIQVTAEDGATEGDPSEKTPKVELPKFLAMNESVLGGEEIVALTRVGPAAGSKLKAGGFALPTRVRITGRDSGQNRFEVNLPIKQTRDHAGYLPRMWAKLEIDRLVASNPLKDRAAIVELSQSMVVMSPFTSLLVLENEDMEKQYKVAAPRKDSWAEYMAPAKIEVVVEPEPGKPDPRVVGKKMTVKQVIDSVLVRSELKSATNGSGPLPSPRGNRPIFEDRKTSPIRVAESNFHLLADLDGSITGSSMFGMALSDAGLVGSIVLNDRNSPTTPAMDSSIALANPGKREAGIVDYFGWRARGQLLPTIDGFASPQAVFAANLPENARAVGIRTHSESLWADFGVPIDQIGIDRLRKLSRFDPTGSLSPRQGAGDWLEYAFKAKAAGIEFPSPISAPMLSREAWDGSHDKTNIGALKFADLARFAPALDLSMADLLSVIASESQSISTKGDVEKAARQIWSTGDVPRWRSWASDGVTITFDTDGRRAYDRAVFDGIKEHVECDGQTLVHIYPQLHIGARRNVSRFHRLAFASEFPFVLPPIEDLAHGADVKLINPTTVVVVPHTKKADDEAVHLHFVFDGNRLREKQWIASPKRKLLLRQVLEPGGDIRTLDGENKTLSLVRGKLKSVAAPEFTADWKDTVILPLPFRSVDVVKQQLKIEKKAINELTLAEALPVFASYFGAGDQQHAVQVFTECFARREQKPLGMYVLLAALGQNLDSGHLDVAGEHPDNPLAQYLALHTSPVLREHASQWAVQSNPWGDGFLARLGLAHALLQRWGNDKIQKLAPATLKAERAKAIDFIRKNKDTEFAWELLSRLQQRTDEKDKAGHRELAGVFELFADDPALGYAAKYEVARSLARAGDDAAARDKFLAVYKHALDAGHLPPIDAAFRSSLEPADLWSKTLQDAAETFIAKKRRAAVLALAWQAWQLEDRVLANGLATRALSDVKDVKEANRIRRLALEYYWKTDQVAAADDLLAEMLSDPENRKNASLWRLGVKYAERREQPARALSCLENALDAEYRNLGDVVNLTEVDTEYGNLLKQYKQLVEAMQTLKTPVPAEFTTKVVRTADRWRALNPGSETPATLAATILRLVGDRTLAWDYQTTPLAKNPHEAEPWKALANSLMESGDRDLADTAFAAAFDAEPTNPQLLWDRAENLRRLGRNPAADVLVRQIAEGRWQPRFQGLVSQAKSRLGS
jgi:Tfp pilus assembly protein PilF